MLPEASLARLGERPAVPPKPVKRAKGLCGYSVDITALFSLSNRYLRDTGLGDVSPIVLLEDGRQLRGFATRSEYEEACTGSFNVARNVLRFSPSPSPGVLDPTQGHEYTIQLSDTLPMVTPEGAVWWVYTDNQLAASFPGDGGQASRSVRITATGRSPQKQAKVPPRLVVGSQAADFTEVRPHHWEAGLTATVPAGPFSVQIVSPKEGPYFIVDTWSMASSGKSRSLLDAPPSTPALVAEGPLLQPGQVRLAGEPPALPAAELVAIGDIAAKMTLAGLEPLASNEVGDIIGVKYSPVRVLEDGKPLPSPMAPCPRVKTDGSGLYCHSLDVVLFSASDSTSPADNGRSYQLVLDSERHFAGGWWLYPDDVLTAATFVGAALIEARAITDGGALTVRLRDADGAVAAEQRFESDALAAGPVRLAPPDSHAYTLELAASGHVVVQDARIDGDGDGGLSTAPSEQPGGGGGPADGPSR